MGTKLSFMILPYGSERLFLRKVTSKIFKIMRELCDTTVKLCDVIVMSDIMRIICFAPPPLSHPLSHPKGCQKNPLLEIGGGGAPGFF